MHWRHAVECLHLLLAGLVLETVPPVLDPFDHGIAVTHDLVCGRARSIIGRQVGLMHRVLYAVDRGFEEGLGDAKDMVAHETNRAITVIDHAVVEPLVWDLTDVALRRAQHSDPLLDQRIGRKRCVPAALQTHELGDVLKILAKDVLITFREHRYVAHAELEQLLASCGVVQYIERQEVNAFVRKKLFRSETAASAGLGEQDKSVADDFHRRVAVE